MFLIGFPLVGEGLRPRGAFSVFAAESQRYCIQNVGVQRVVQGWAPDPARGVQYTMDDNPSDTFTTVYRSAFGGCVNKTASAQDADADIGHQSLTVEPATGRLVARCRSNARGIVRFSFTLGGAPANKQIWTLMPANVGITNPTISLDGKMVTTGEDLTTHDVLVRVWDAATVFALAPGDLSASTIGQNGLLAEWTIPAGLVSSGTQPLQAVAAHENYLYAAVGFGGTGTGFKLVSWHLMTGTGRVETTRLVGYDQSVLDNVGVVTKMEPEALAIHIEDGQVSLGVMIAAGAGSEYTARVYLLGVTAKRQTAAELVASIAANCTISPARQAIYLDFIGRYMAAGAWHEYFSGFYMLAAENEGQARLNLYNPGVETLAKIGGLTFTVDRGYTGNGTTGMLDTGRGWKSRSVYLQRRAHVAVYCRSLGKPNGGLIGTSSSAYVYFNPRNDSEMISVRMNDTQATVGAASPGASGLWLLNRRPAVGYTVKRDNVLVGTFSTASEDLATGGMLILGSESTKASAQASLAHAGYDLPDAMQSQVVQIDRDFLAAVDALSAGFDFTLGTMPSGASLTRASAGTRYNAAGTLISEAANTPRFDYDPAALTLRGLLIEAQRTNLLPYSSDFDNASWSKATITITANQAVAPDGSTTMDLCEETASGANIRRATSVTAGTFTVSFVVKRTNSDWVNINQGDTNTIINGVQAWFNIATGALGSSALIGTGWSYVAHQITALGNGMYRISLTATGSGTNLVSRIQTASANGSSTRNNVGSGVGVGSSFLLWGAQLEAGDRSSYIATTSAAVTRSADVVTLDWASRGVANGSITARYAFDDATTQDVVTTVTSGISLVPATLNRSRIRIVEKL